MSELSRKQLSSIIDHSIRVHYITEKIKPISRRQEVNKVDKLYYFTQVLKTAKYYLNGCERRIVDGIEMLEYRELMEHWESLNARR